MFILRLFLLCLYFGYFIPRPLSNPPWRRMFSKHNSAFLREIGVFLEQSIRKLARTHMEKQSAIGYGKSTKSKKYKKSAKGASKN